MDKEIDKDLLEIVDKLCKDKNTSRKEFINLAIRVFIENNKDKDYLDEICA